MIKRSITLLTLAALASAVAPAPAIPILDPGTPSVEVWTNPGDDAFTWVLHAEAHDPDGPVKKISLCVVEPGGEVCHDEIFDEPLTPVQQIERCLAGKAEDFHVQHRFPDYGVYTVIARVIGGGCPVVGTDEQVEAATTVNIVRPGEPIACAEPGTPTATDVGITETTIEVAATVAISGPLSNVTASAVKGLHAALNDVNAAGGVCGRSLSLEIRDDGFDAARGKNYIQSFISAEKFALVGMPSGPGLEAAIASGVIDAAGIPVVGTGAQSEAEFSSPWVWPVAPSNATFGKVGTRHAYQEGSRTFAVVWGDYAGGPEARSAVHSTIEQLPGAALGGDRRVSLSEPSYESVINDLDFQCRASVGDVCEALIVVLDTTNTAKLMQAAQRLGRKFDDVEITPWAFTDILVRDAPFSEGSVSWTGFMPPIAPANAAAARYAELISLYYGVEDTKNPIMEAAYTGMLLFAHAIGRVGVNLTRVGLKNVLDTQSFDLGLTAGALSWNPDRHANRWLRGYRAVEGTEGRIGWQSETEWVSAP